MITLSLIDIAQAVSGELVGDNITINSINTDSRALQECELFLALKGPNFDGHRFIEQVIELGCAAIIVDHQCDTDIPQIQIISGSG